MWNTRYQDAAATQRATLTIANRLGDSRSKAYALANEIRVSTIVSPKQFAQFVALKKETIEAAYATNDAYIQAWAWYVIGFEELHRGLVNDARESARKLIHVGHQLNDPRPTGFGLSLLTWIALASDFMRKHSSIAKRTYPSQLLHGIELAAAAAKEAL